MDKMVEIKWHNENARKMTVHNKNGVVYLTIRLLTLRRESFMDSVPDWEGKPGDLQFHEFKLYPGR